MDYKELKSKIEQDFNLYFYDNKLLKSLASKVKQSDTLISAFECIDSENNMCLVIATKQSMLISTNQFFKSSKISVIKLANVTDNKLKKGLFRNQIIISNVRRDTVFSKISQKAQLNSLISLI